MTDAKTPSWPLHSADRRAATSPKAGLATLYDFSAAYNVNAHFLVSGYLGHAAGGAFAGAIYPKGKNANFDPVSKKPEFKICAVAAENTTANK